MMKAIVIDKFGGPEELQLKEIAIPSYHDDQILVKVKAAGVNPVDWKIREGYLTPAFEHSLPLVPGWEMAGIVEAVGAKVGNFNPGDEVYCYNRLPVIQHGTYAEYSVADASTAAIKPTNLDFATAATIPLAALTAWQAIVEFGDLQKSESIFITAGSGGVGGFAIQIAKHLGARVCAAASNNNQQYLHTLGVDRALDYNQDNLIEEVRTFGGDGVDLVLDCTGREDIAVNFDYVKPGSRIATINGLLHTAPLLEQLASQYNVKAELVFVEPNGAQLAKISELIQQQAIKPLPVKTFPIEQAREAQNISQGGHVKGKLAINIG